MLDIKPSTLPIVTVASKDASRANLNVLHCEQSGAVVATNGHVLIVVPNGCEGAEAPVSIKRDSIEELRAHLKRNPFKGPAIPVRAGKFETGSASLPAEVQEIDFPTWRQIMPKDGETPHAMLTLSTSVLEELAKLMKSMGMGTLTLRIMKDDPTAPVRLDFTTRDGAPAIGVVMQARAGTGRGADNFHNAATPVPALKVDAD